MDASYGFAKNFINAKFEDIPKDAVEITRREILDILGVALGGSGKPGVKELLDLYTEWGGKEESTVFCYGNKLPAPNAVQVNATMSHALDYDDTGDLVSLEILDASRRVAETRKIGFETIESSNAVPR